MSDTSNASPRLIRVWDPGVRIFHWFLVIAIALAFLSSEEESAFSAWHIPIGWVAALLIAFRLVWGFVGGEHARFVNFVRPSRIVPHVRHLLSGKVMPTLGHNALGAVAVLALLGLTAATILTGASGGEDGHEAIAYALLGLVGVHIAAVLLMSRLTKENLILAMVTGRKRELRVRPRRAEHARSSRLWRQGLRGSCAGFRLCLGSGRLTGYACQHVGGGFVV